MAIRAQLFITCLADQFFPGVLMRMVGLLERLGVQVSFPEEQTCCGQPFFNSGFREQARDLARQWMGIDSWPKQNADQEAPPIATCHGRLGSFHEERGKQQNGGDCQAEHLVERGAGKAK